MLFEKTLLFIASCVFLLLAPELHAQDKKSIRLLGKFND